jgi:hypothetical protein
MLRESLVALSAFASLPGASLCQGVPRFALGGAEARIAGAYRRGDIRVCELTDGRVLYVDGDIKLADFRSGKTTQVGRRGRGPNEYPYLKQIYCLAGDSALVPTSERKWLILHGPKIARTVTFTEDHLSSEVVMTTTGADTIGFASAMTPGQTAYLIRLHRTTLKVKTLTLIASTPVVRAGSWVYYPILSSYDRVTHFPDGWIAVARFDPYRVDWWSEPHGMRAGKPLPYQVVPLDDRERKTYADARARKYGKKGVVPKGFPEHWSKELPPFEMVFNNPLGMPDGRLLVRRSERAGSTEIMHDIVDREGRLGAQLVLAMNQRVVGFGKHSVYVVEEDDDGEEWLCRMPWPH